MNQAAVSVKQRQRPDLLFLTTFCPGENPEKSCYDLLFLTTVLTTKYPAKAGSIRHTRITKNPRNIDFSSTFRGYSLVRGRGFEPPRINHTHLKRARLPVPPPSHTCFTVLRFLRQKTAGADCLHIVTHFRRFVKWFLCFS